MDRRQLHKKAVESRYFGVCDVYERRNVRNEGTKITESKEVCVLKRQPCRVSFSSISAAAKQQNAAIAGQVVKLFIDPLVEIREGSRIVVTQNGKTEEYRRSGIPAVYFSHQEITLERFGGYV